MYIYILSKSGTTTNLWECSSTLFRNFSVTGFYQSSKVLPPILSLIIMVIRPARHCSQRLIYFSIYIFLFQKFQWQRHVLCGHSFIIHIFIGIVVHPKLKNRSIGYDVDGMDTVQFFNRFGIVIGPQQQLTNLITV